MDNLTNPWMADSRPLLAEIEKLTKERDALRKALEFYAAKINHVTTTAGLAPVVMDGGIVARAAIAPTKEPQATDEHPLARMHADLMAAPKTKDGSHG